MFSFYWLITIFFNLPDNYLKATFLEYESLFSFMFYQRWSFFAPPPTSDDRLYYIFKNRTDSTASLYTFEVIEDLSNIRRSKAPFNEETVIDYIISNSLTSMTDIIRDQYKLYQKANCVENDSLCFQKFSNSSWANFGELSQIKTLFNYGRILAKKQNINLNEYKMKFIIGQSFIPKFKDRMNKKERKEIITFETPYINLN
jgi:hypothetical protein